MLRPEAELLIKADVLRALGEREEACLTYRPLVEQVDDRLHQASGDAATPEVGPNGERPKNPKLPHLVAKFEPTTSPSSSAANAQRGSAAKRDRT